MAKEAKQVLDELCTAILNSSTQDINKLVDWSRELYENLVIMQYLSNQLPSNYQKAEKYQASETQVGKKVSSSANVTSENEENQTSSSVEIITSPGANDTNKESYIDNIVIENKDEKIVEKKLHVGTSTISKTVYTETRKEKIEMSLSDNTLALNERLAASSRITIGLNDKIAFSRQLFNGDEQAMMNLIDRMNHAHTFEQAMNHLHQARTQFDFWEEKKEYVTRLENLIRRKFGVPEITED
ncbi:MAG: hypothetical protein ACK4KT_04310 [Thermaurantimonas sp.]